MRRNDGIPFDQINTVANGGQQQLLHGTNYPVLGLDVGGVLVDRVAEASNTSFFGTQPLQTPAVPGSRDAVPQLVELFEDRVHIVSKTGPQVAGLTTAWLTHHGYIHAEFVSHVNAVAAPSPGNSATANSNLINRSHLHYVRSRHEKHPVSRDLGITHFVDDRIEVLQHLVTVSNRYLFTGGLGNHRIPTEIPEGITVIANWATLVEVLTKSVS